LREHLAEFEGAGVGVAVIGLGDRDYARAFREETGIRFPLLIDGRREAYRAAGLKRGSVLDIFRAENLAARRAAREAGHRQGRLGRAPLQLGGSFVFGPGDTDLYAHANRTYGDNAPVVSLLAAARRRIPPPI
jgi:hypothetical protein